MNSILALIYFICCHGGPASHFSVFAEDLALKGHDVEVLATGPAYERLEKQGAVDFNPEGLNIDDPLSQQILAESIAKRIEPGSIIITDVGHILMARVQEEIAKDPTIKRLAYYDNPEPYVPGGYSEIAAEVISKADQVLFSNAKLAVGKGIGIGYYPLPFADFLKWAREKRHDMRRKDFFELHHLKDVGQKIIVYFGGNNEVYFSDAFPAFLNILNEANLDPTEYLVLIQQHPGAKPKKIEQALTADSPVIISYLSTEEAIITADYALYYQTSMGPQFVIAGLPTIQIGHEPYLDILVRNHLAPSVTSSADFIQALQNPQHPNPSHILEDLGIQKDWSTHLENALLEISPQR